MRRPVRVHAMTLGLSEGQEPSEWYASCTDALYEQQPDGTWQQRGCNWYGAYRDTPGAAKADAARHRRSH